MTLSSIMLVMPRLIHILVFISLATAAVSDMAIFILQIELSKYFAVNTATPHAHYEGEATYNIGISFKGRPHFNIIKIHPQARNEGEAVGDSRKESE